MVSMPYVSLRFARPCDHYNDFSERHISLCESLLRKVYKYGFLCKELCSTFNKQTAIFAKYSKSLEDIKRDIPFSAMVVNLLNILCSIYVFGYILSWQRLVRYKPRMTTVAVKRTSLMSSGDWNGMVRYHSNLTEFPLQVFRYCLPNSHSDSILRHPM